MRFKELTLTFQTPAGLDGSLVIELDAADRPSEIIKALDAKLIEAGCKPKPQPARGGFPRKQPEIAPDKKCPKCGGAMTLRQGKRQDGSEYKGYGCLKPKDTCNGWLKA